MVFHHVVFEDTDWAEFSETRSKRAYRWAEGEQLLGSSLFSTLVKIKKGF